MQRIILASGSAQRKSLMAAINLPFEAIPADIDEKTIRDPEPKGQAEKIARAKAENVADREKGIIIAADSFVVHNQSVLEKPQSLEEAKNMMSLLSGKTSIIYSGFCYLDRENKIDYSTTVPTEFTFRNLTEQEIVAYVKNFPVTTWSGGFSPAYPYGLTLISDIKGSLTGLTHGLPMELVIQYLGKSGIRIKP